MTYQNARTKWTSWSMQPSRQTRRRLTRIKNRPALFSPSLHSHGLYFLFSRKIPESAVKSIPRGERGCGEGVQLVTSARTAPATATASGGRIRGLFGLVQHPAMLSRRAPASGRQIKVYELCECLWGDARRTSPHSSSRVNLCNNCQCGSSRMTYCSWLTKK